ncbi:hypothetical protein HK097_005354 [Rhizophlyctis rosea]|uniref:Uncharacterized protein n=1 Tax=Rhizophlyctis rosea TaxID=64517 RepID=A0AAD5SLB1_9FUNG|nr:hypothetical protein HK097_005354 [Rhizophlyctis rosea]
MKQLERACKAAGSPEVIALCLDLSKPNSVTTLYRSVKSNFGGIDSIFLNHLGGPAPGFFTLNTEDDIASSINVNVHGMTLLVRGALPFLVESKGTLTYSSSASILLPLPTITLYRAAKQYMTTLLESIREELLLMKKSVSITTCVFGSVETECFDANVGTKARLEGKDIVLSDSMLKTAVGMLDGARFLISATEQRREVAYGPQRDIVIGKWVAWFLNLFPAGAKALARSVNIISSTYLNSAVKQAEEERM